MTTKKEFYAPKTTLESTILQFRSKCILTHGAKRCQTIGTGKTDRAEQQLSLDFTEEEKVQAVRTILQQAIALYGIKTTLTVLAEIITIALQSDRSDSQDFKQM